MDENLLQRSNSAGMIPTQNRRFTINSLKEMKALISPSSSSHMRTFSDFSKLDSPIHEQTKVHKYILKVSEYKWCIIMAVIVFFSFFFTFLLSTNEARKYEEKISDKTYNDWAMHNAECAYGGRATNITSFQNGTYVVECLDQLNWKGYVTLGVLYIVTIGLYLNYPHDIVTLGGTCLLLFLKIIDFDDAFSAFSNPSILSIGVLFIVARAVEKSGIVTILIERILFHPKNIFVAIAQTSIFTFIFSVFINNTPVVIMLLPVIENWAQTHSIPASYILLPLSYAAMLGGSCCLIGSGNNLLIQSLIESTHQYIQPFSMFEMTLPGLFIGIIAIIYMILMAKFLLPNNSEKIISEDQQYYRYVIPFTIPVTSKIHGQTILQSGLMCPYHTKLMKIEREKQSVGIYDETILYSRDILYFAGDGESLNLLRFHPSLLLVTQSDGISNRSTLVEVVLDKCCPLINKVMSNAIMIKEYNCDLLAVKLSTNDMDNLYKKNFTMYSRDSPIFIPSDNINDNNLSSSRIFEIGDILLLNVNESFIKLYSNSSHFGMIRNIDNSIFNTTEKKIIIVKRVVTIIIFIIMILLPVLNFMNILISALFASSVLIITRCLTVDEAFSSINYRLMLTLISTFGLGKAAQSTGVSTLISNFILSLGKHSGSYGLLCIEYLFTVILSALIGNYGSAVIMFPVVINVQISDQMSYSLKQNIMILMFAISNTFLSHIGYQTNLIVYNPGGYHYKDYVAFGFPLQILCMITAVSFTLLFIK